MIYLHIGQGKAGSTTIQNILEKNRTILASRNIIVPDISHHFCAKILSAPEEQWSAEDRQLIDRLRGLLASPDANIIMSSEYFSTLRESGQFAALKKLLGGRPTQILVYLRDYPGAIVSQYNQATKKGKNTHDFDSYFEKKLSSMSWLPWVEAWGNAFGWENLRIRTLDSRSLEGGNLTVDFFAGTALDRLKGIELAGEDRANASEHWITIEIRRQAAIAMKKDPEAVIDRRQFGKIARVLDLLVHKPLARHAPGLVKARYLTTEQWQTLNALYKSDIEYLNARIAQPLPLTGAPPSGEREFLPCFESIPKAIRVRLQKTLQTAHPEHKLSAGQMQVLQQAFHARQKSVEVSYL